MDILSLPPNVMINIFSYLHQKDLVNSVRKTCTLWCLLSKEKILWKTVNMQKFCNFQFSTKAFIDMLSRVYDCVEILYMDLKQLNNDAILHENITCSNLRKLCVYWNDSQSFKSRRHDRTPQCQNGQQIHVLLPLLSAKYTNLKSLHLLSHVVYIDDLLDLFLELEELEIEYCDLSHDHVEDEIKTFFNNHSKIKHLSIRSSVFDNRTLTFILSYVPGLKFLDLSNSNFKCGEIDTTDIKQKALETLDLTNTRSNDKLFGCLVKQSKGLKHVSIGDCVDLTNNGLEILAENCPDLKTLVINEAEYAKCNITDSGLQKIAEHCGNIHVLKMVYCDEIGDLGVQAISEASPHLRVLEAAGCTAVTDAAVFCIIKNCPLIEKLDLGHCVQLTSASINKLILACKNLRYLNLETCHRLADINLESVDTVDVIEKLDGAIEREGASVSTDEIEVMLDNEAVVEKEEIGSSVLEMDVSEVVTHPFENKDRVDVTDPSAVQQNVSIFQWHSHLQTLNLGFCSKLSNMCVKQIAKHCPDLQCLNLQGCAMVTNAGVLAVVQGCAHLRKLNISGGSVFQTSRLNNDCLFHISKYCKNLSKLIITKNNHITAEGVFQVIQNCPDIEELNFASSRSYSSSGIKMESLTNAAGEVKGKTICIKILGNNAKIIVTKDVEYKLRQK